MTVQMTLPASQAPAASFWVLHDPIPHVECSQHGSPAVARINQSLCVVYPRSSDQNLCWTLMTQGSWTQPVPVVGDSAPALSPVLARTMTGLLLVWQQNGSHEIYSSHFDGARSSWGPKAHVSTGSGAPLLSSTVPALVSFGSRVLMVGVSVDGSQAIWYSLFNGTSWSDKKLALGQTDRTPALVFLEDDDTVVMTWTSPNGSLKSAEYQAKHDEWLPWADVLGPKNTYDRPVLANYYERPLMVWNDSNPNVSDMWYSFYDGTKWMGAERISDSRRQPGTQPAVAGLDDKIYLVWTRKDRQLSYATAQTIQRTVDFGTASTELSFDLIREEWIHRTFIKKSDGTYARGKLDYPKNGGGDITLTIGNGEPSPDYSLNNVVVSFENNALVELARYQGDLSSGEWRVTLPGQILQGTAGTIHVFAEWKNSNTGTSLAKVAPPLEDPVIIVNVGN